MSFSLHVSLTSGESGLLSAVAAASFLSVLVNNSVFHPYYSEDVMGAAGELNLTFFRLQRAEPGCWGEVWGPGQALFRPPFLSPFCHPSVTGLSLPFLSQLSEPCNQRPETEGRLVKLENLLFIFIPSLFVPWLRNSFACLQSSAGPKL